MCDMVPDSVYIICNKHLEYILDVLYKLTISTSKQYFKANFLNVIFNVVSSNFRLNMPGKRSTRSGAQ